MEPLVFFAVLAGALMHAGWNAVVKLGLDRFSAILLLSLSQSAIALALLPYFATPAPAAWPWIAGSALLHTGYKLFLIQAYRHGDLSQVYPLARGTAPLIVALVGALVLGEPMTGVKTAAVLAIGLGVMVMSLRGGARGEGGLAAMPRAAFAWAMGTAAFTASYTLADGVGARLAQGASGFALWMFTLDGLTMALYGLATQPAGVFRRLLPAWRSGVLAGALSLGSYWIAIWAFTKAPLALVAALRESSVLFAMLIAALFLREPASAWRWLAGGLILSGVMLMRI